MGEMNLTVNPSEGEKSAHSLGGENSVEQNVKGQELLDLSAQKNL